MKTRWVFAYVRIAVILSGRLMTRGGDIQQDEEFEAKLTEAHLKDMEDEGTTKVVQFGLSSAVQWCI